MADMPTLRDILNGTPGDATDVEWNFNTLETHIESELIRADGANPMAADLDLDSNKVINLATPTAATDAATKGYVDSLSLGKMAYAAVTANQAGISATDDLAGLSATFTAVTGRSYKITGSVYLSSSIAGDVGAINIATSGNVQIQSAQAYLPATGVQVRMIVAVVISPSAGSVTYKMRASRASGTGSLTMGAAATYPAFILVEDIGVA